MLTGEPGSFALCICRRRRSWSRCLSVSGVCGWVRGEPGERGAGGFPDGWIQSGGAIPGTRELITWQIRGVGFDMLLSGKVPSEIGKALGVGSGLVLGKLRPEEVALWGVHPGAKSVLAAVEKGLGLGPAALWASREVLEEFGNMSSATVMFVLEKPLRKAKAGDIGVCDVVLGRGLTARETMMFTAA